MAVPGVALNRSFTKKSTRTFLCLRFKTSVLDLSHADLSYALERVLSDMVWDMYCDRFERYADLVFSRFGGDLLSHVLRRSTISATALNGRVRNGAGCFARAMATKPRKYQIQVKHVCVYAF